MNQPTPSRDSSSVTEAVTRKARAITAPGGWLDQRRQELTAAIDDFATAERWVRVLAYTLALAIAALVVGTAGGILLQAAGAVIGLVHLPAHIPGTGDGLAVTITRPVHTYLTHHTAGLPLTEATAYGTWKTAGLLIGLLAGITQAAMARLAWTSWSAATIAMVWQNARNCIGCNIAHGDESRVCPGRCSLEERVVWSDRRTGLRPSM
jgi:hypothetical protein